IERDPGEDTHERKQDVESDRKRRDQPAVPEQALHLVWKSRKLVGTLRARCTRRLRRQPEGDTAGAYQGRGAQSEKTHAPVESLGEQAGTDASAEPAECRSADIEAHDQRYPVWRPLLANVGDKHR